MIIINYLLCQKHTTQDEVYKTLQYPLYDSNHYHVYKNYIDYGNTVDM